MLEMMDIVYRVDVVGIVDIKTCGPENNGQNESYINYGSGENCGHYVVCCVHANCSVGGFYFRV